MHACVIVILCPSPQSASPRVGFLTARSWIKAVVGGVSFHVSMTNGRGQASTATGQDAEIPGTCYSRLGTFAIGSGLLVSGSKVRVLDDLRSAHRWFHLGSKLPRSTRAPRDESPRSCLTFSRRYVSVIARGMSRPGLLIRGSRVRVPDGSPTTGRTSETPH